MKPTITFLSLLFVFSFCNGQNQGTIKSREIKPKAGISNQYFYAPPNHLVAYDKMEISVMTLDGKEFYQKNLPLVKTGKGYSFTFKAPFSAAVIIFAVKDSKKQIIDNNSEKGYICYLYNRLGKRFISEGVMLAKLLNGFGQFTLKLEKTPNISLIKMYEDSYRKYPALTKEDSYVDYLNVLYKEKKDEVKPKLLSYASQMVSSKANESKWMNAASIFRLLKMGKEQESIEQKAVNIYPDGDVAKDNFWEKFYHADNPTELSRITSMEEYIKRFKDSSAIIRDNFYISIIALSLDNKDWSKAEKYEYLMHNKLNVAYLYNSYAGRLSSEAVDSTGAELTNAKMLSKKSVLYTGQLINNLQTSDVYNVNLQNTYNGFADKYALLLFKTGSADSAFYYQNEIYKQEGKLNNENIGRYAEYAEKAKGPEFAKQIIEEQLIKGVTCTIVSNQLHSIYKELNLSEDDFNKLNEKSIFIKKQENNELIKARFGTTKAKDIILKNTLGQKVSLSSFKNKVVVLDFWATWCIPCRASFPAMQEIINKYKNDQEVEFLFIDVFENANPKKMQENAAKVLKENNYSFNVLLDINDKVSKDYKIESIPSKFIIDKKGNITFMGDPSNIAIEIENAKK